MGCCPKAGFFVPKNTGNRGGRLGIIGIERLFEMLYNNEKYRTIEISIIRKDVPELNPIRYFVVNNKTKVMHIYGYCQQTKPRNIPIRLFDTSQELEAYTGRKLCLCKDCAKQQQQAGD